MYRLKHVLLTLSLSTIALTLLSMSLSSQPLFAQSAPGQPDDAVIGPLLQEEMSENSGDANYVYQFIITLKDQVEFDYSRLPEDADTRRAEIVRSLKQRATESQRVVIDDLDDLSQRSQIQSYQSFWIFNGMAAEGTADAIRTLSKHPHIESIKLDKQIEPIRPVEDLSLFAGEATTQTWGTNYIKAPQVWHGLGITGTGVTVAIMDSGVDFTHPLLSQNYRGRNPDGSFQHKGNWFHPAHVTETIPVDYIGHGTHVAGTAVGSNGIGVAPGAEWIAVALADNSGAWFDSYIHSAFEWLLAPNGDPSLAPDIVNGSWGGYGGIETFVNDMELLKQSGIIPVFSAGNSGPFTQTLGAPASYTNTVSVASISPNGKTSWYSSRGPSLLHDNVSPIIGAPGGFVYSAMPGNSFATLSGTSMAAPHVSGSLALLLSHNMSLKNNDLILSILKESAIPFEQNHPNVSSGYGRLDSVELIEDFVEGLTNFSGIVQSNGDPVPNEPITITSQTGSFTTETDVNGQYSVRLRAGKYNIEANIFGFESYDSGPVSITGNRTVLNVSLSRQPAGIFTGKVVDGTSNNPISKSKVTIIPGNIEVFTDNDGEFETELPAGSYEANVIRTGYEIGSTSIQISEGQTTVQSYSLPPASSILLIDAGSWNFRSREQYYEESFIQMGTGWDTYKIENPIFGLPDAETLSNYDVVIWSDPRYSPGYIGASTLISDYASAGGNMLVSGNNIARIDSNHPIYGYWMSHVAFARPKSQITVTKPLFGAEDTTLSAFRGELNGNDSSDDQQYITVIDPLYPNRAESIINHGELPTDGRSVGIKAGHCENYNIIYLGFEVSGVQGKNDRAELLAGALDWLERPLVETDVKWINSDVDMPVISGESYGYDVTVYNRSETMTRTFDINSTGDWSTSILTPNLTIGPCQAARTTVTVTVPAGLAQSTKNQTQFTVQDTGEPSANDVFIIDQKTPSSILLVEDYRWYNQNDVYKASLDDLGVSYDVWTFENMSKASPSISLLSEYDYVVWYTAYDWFEPIKQDEISLLEQYLLNGGRLFLNSQDFNYYHSNTYLAHNYFGLDGFAESITATIAFGNGLLSLGGRGKKDINLSFSEYSNHSDALFVDPSSAAAPLLWHDRGVGGVGNAGQGQDENWRAVFWSIPFETLETQSHSQVMANTLGWLTDLGESTISAENEFLLPGQTQSFTITLSNRTNGITQTATISNPLPASLILIESSLPDEANWSAADQTITWQGVLAPGETRHIQYQAVVQGSGNVLNQLFIRSDAEKFGFQRGTIIQVGGANYSESRSSAEFSPPLLDGRRVTVSVSIMNNGDAAGQNITATTYIPDEFNYLTDTLSTISGSAVYSRSRIIWTGDLTPNQTVTVTAVYTTPYFYLDDWVQSNLTVADDEEARWIKHDTRFFEAIKNWLPVLNRSR
ncbi:MAG: S8 family serine peptidase [Chloroflexota bacterium]